MSVRLLAISAWSGTGKTTLLEQVIPLLKAQGIRSGLIKHTHHQMDIDTPGKDSYLLRKAGADQVIVASNQRWALMVETLDKPLSLTQLASQMDSSTLDLVLVEGFKDEAVPKIALWRRGVKGKVEDLLDQYVIAIATDENLEVNLPVLDINQPMQVADFIVQWLKKS
ncbi:MULTISPECIES: molybdopterin-guanine dinucleotide biosynthesis protein MobB [unclassified Enterobacter]|jgi:molybdopterin-guanine dinucleotide biosynthesis protein B|uniref:molybdopterin-guanine dinucleotide biosynthesis protein MobB n=1 Tax=unclassified Enterobacter TaxID=2608935 RepID=UPI0015CCC1C8|nr:MULTISPECIES: molybdopterin-guanine dinucleotide biosynthesis protein MobB [unclassified Enterobacter]MBB3308022.1 molybdopterin-guanine dinucleotide biosynthesis protein B [Enterobacter sp. Sphag1F]NYI16834.1 molybdopterin-guanine dinucleotide biosynthesis protein B [Enterobacter sp. Sphag71]